MSKKYHKMSTESHYNIIRKEAENIRVAPPATAWSKIQNRMKKASDEPSGWKITSRFILSIAASVFLAVLCYNVIIFNIEYKSDSLKGKIVAWEDLDYGPDYLYSVEKVRELKQFYMIDSDISIN